MESLFNVYQFPAVFSSHFFKKDGFIAPSPVSQKTPPGKLPGGFIFSMQRAQQGSQLLIVSIRLTLQSGGSLADVLLRISQTIRGRIEFQQKLQALTAQGRFEALAMSLAPLLAFILLFIINNELMLPMVKSLIGWCAIGVMLTLEVIGYMVIRVIVDIKV